MQRHNRSPSCNLDSRRTFADDDVDLDEGTFWSTTLPEQHRSHGDTRSYHGRDSFSAYCYPARGFPQNAQPNHSEEYWRSRYTSPTYSGTSAGPPSSTSAQSDGDSSPRYSPGLEDPRYPSMSTVLSDETRFSYSGHGPLPDHTDYPTTFVTLPDVQAYADESHDTPDYGPQMEYMSHNSDHEYRPIHGQATAEGHTSASNSARIPVHQRFQEQFEESRPVVFRHRRAQSAGAKTTSGRVNRRPNMPRRGASHQQGTRSEPSSSRPNLFPCRFVVYGCTREFSSKNEWKRHIQTQHVRLEYWRCTQCVQGGTSDQDKIFNRKDLFTQHIFRMHSSQSEQSTARGHKTKSESQRRYEDAEAESCRRTMRRPPEASQCIVCEQRFEDPGGWEQCIDHIGKHLDTAARDGPAHVLNPQTWRVDHALQQYLRNEGILTIDDRGFFALNSSS